MLTTLAAVKTQLKITNTSQDAFLTPFIGSASALVRDHCKRWLGAMISAISVADAAVVTCLAHGLQDQDIVWLARTDSTPKLDGGPYTITVIDDDTFSVPVTTSGAGTKGYILRQVTEYYCGNNRNALLLKERPVWLSGLTAWRDQTGYWGQGTLNTDDPPFATDADALVLGQDYAPKLDGPNAAYSTSGMLIRINAVWPQIVQKLQGMLSLEPIPGLGNIKIQYVYGYLPVPASVQLATNMMVVQLARAAAVGGPLKSERFDYYSYQLADSGSSAGQPAGPSDPLGQRQELAQTIQGEPLVMGGDLTQGMLDNAWGMLPDSQSVSITRNKVTLVSGIEARRRNVSFTDRQYLATMAVDSQVKTWMLRVSTMNGVEPLNDDYIVDENNASWRVKNASLEMDDTVFRCVCTLQRGT